MGILTGMLGIAIFAYFGLMFLFIFIGFLASKTIRSAIITTTLIIALFTGPIIIAGIGDIWYRIKVNPARTLFYKFCATAEENIYDIADNVEGILLLNIRKRDNGDNTNLHWSDAALPDEYVGEDYIRSFLDGKYHIPEHIKGRFLYVDVKEGDEFMRYQLKKGSNHLAKERSPPQLARYEVAFVNNNGRQDGIAGTTIIINDTWKKKTMAKKTWYSFSPHFVANGTGNWKHAETCPKANTFPPTRNFVDRVIQPQKDH